MSLKVIISGGGTGGHIFPAIAIANGLKEMVPTADILFVGASGKMEMEKVPQAGYPIKGLEVAGLQRKINLKNVLKNLQFPYKLLKSLREAKRIIQEFHPNVVVGVGGYASGPLLWVAQSAGIPTLIQEQNSHAGITNKLLAKGASKICVAYEGMNKYFPSDKLVLTGNPVRKDILDVDLVKLAGCTHFKLDPGKKTILVIGGSLGAKMINESLADGLEKIKQSGCQLIWQTGKNYIPAHGYGEVSWMRILPFIKEMHWAYACADVVISRAGALSISELCLAGKPAILVPSPNVAEDHQTVNAMALVNRSAAMMIKDSEAKFLLVDKALELVSNLEKCNELTQNIRQMAKPNAANDIVKELLALVKE